MNRVELLEEALYWVVLLAFDGWCTAMLMGLVMLVERIRKEKERKR